VSEICPHPDLDAAGNCKLGCGFNSDVEHYAAIARGEDVYGDVPEADREVWDLWQRAEWPDDNDEPASSANLRLPPRVKAAEDRRAFRELMARTSFGCACGHMLSDHDADDWDRSGLPVNRRCRIDGCDCGWDE
jgi:hypothetical protein